jgi:hypothetical protein
LDEVGEAPCTGVSRQSDTAVRQIASERQVHKARLFIRGSKFL